LARVLVIYASAEGQTARVAERIAARLRRDGHAVDVRPIEAGADGPDPAAYDGILVGASVHFGRHPETIARFVQTRRPALQSRPSGFFSLSLSAGGPAARPADARDYVEAFLAATGWQPDLRASFGGALRYSGYPAWKRFVMRRIMRSAGGDTDTSRDHEYTDWQAVDALAGDFSARLPGRRPG
jgi:menaquinone-dependent protoporphyrinogen oxidase